MAAAVTSCGNGGTVPDCGSQVEQALSFAGENRAEREKVLDRNIGIGSPEAGAVPMWILTGVYGDGKRNYVYSVEFFE